MNNRRYYAYGDYKGGYDPVPSGPDFGTPMFQPAPGPFGGPPGPPCPPGPRGRGPRGPSGPPFQGGFGPSTMEDKAIRYLTRCGIPKASLKDIPRELLDLFEPHYCGLCGHHFESFDLSRVHYISKNHNKNVKKWSRQTTYPKLNQRPQEAPLKARNLYCELCNVEITSQVHADSHYAGKSHRAVVEGRKNPKNPVLLQPGMERRVQQLIRREKKFINDKPAEGETKEEKPKKDGPNVSPELYCDICKTHVTCSEQMTMHMNGKRHLTKEKQYILKAMSGEGQAAESIEIKTEGNIEQVDKEQEGNEDLDYTMEDLYMF